MTKSTGLPHLPQLDGVRAIAVGLVFLGHCGLDKFIPGGFGVTVFFFLSGYLITSLMRSEAAKTGRIDLISFYIRRTVRIWPPLYITMAICAVVSLVWFPNTKIDISGVIAQMLFFTNYAGVLNIGAGVPGPPLWSLAVEEHFYLIFPLVFAWRLHKQPPMRVAKWCGWACVLVLAVRFCSALYITDITAIYYWSHTRIDSILFGCCLALWQNPLLDKNVWRPRKLSVGFALFLLLICLIIRNEFFRQTLRYSLQGISLFILFSWILQTRSLFVRVLSSAPMRRIGLYSYTLYLVHRLFIASAISVWPQLSIQGLIIVSGAASMLFAAGMYSLVERPMALLRRSLHKTDQSATVAPT